MLCSGLPKGGHLLIGADVQDSLGVSEDGERLRRNIVGPCAEENVGDRGQAFVNLMVDLNLVALNTFEQEREWGTFTCHYNFQHMPKQIDYVLVSRQILRRGSSRPLSFKPF